MNNGQRRKFRKLLVHRDGTCHQIDKNNKKKLYSYKIKNVDDDIISHESYESYYEELDE